MGNEQSLPPINGTTPTINTAVNRIVSELNGLFSTFTPNEQYIQTFAATLRDKLEELEDAVTDLQTNTPSPQTQLTALQNDLAILTSSLSSYISTNNTTVSNLSTFVSALQTSVNNIQTSLGSTNVVLLNSTVSSLSSSLATFSSQLSAKVDNTITINGKPLSSNVVLIPADLGLGNVNNTSDLAKPISTAVQTALNQKITSGTPITPATVGNSSSVPIISYNSEGIITSANNVTISISPTQASLGNVPNVDCTKASNVLVDLPLTPSTSNVLTNDTVHVAVSKLQNQQNNKVTKVIGATNDHIPLLNTDGSIKNSTYIVNDLGTTNNDILTANGVTDRINNALTGLLNLRGTHSTSLFPSTGGSGISGAVNKGDTWYYSGSPTTIGGFAVNNGDVIIALVNSPGQINTNWSIASSSLSFTPENVANKETTVLSNSAVFYPTSSVVKTYVDTVAATKENTITATTNLDYYRGDKTFATLTPAAVGLGNVTNNHQLYRSAADYNSFISKPNPIGTDVVLVEDSQDVFNKKKITLSNVPLSANAISALNDKVDKVTTVNTKPLSSNIVLTPSDIGLGNVDNTTDLTKPISNLTSAALSNKVDKLNLSSGGSIGSSTTIPVITFNNQGQILTGTSTAFNVTKNDVGLGNVLNVDTTSLENITLQGAYTPINLAVAGGDDGKIIAEKLQGQINTKAAALSPAVNGAILVSNVQGNLANSNKVFNDSGSSSSDILSAAEVITRINNGGSGLSPQGLFNPSGSYPSATNAGQYWIIGTGGLIGSISLASGDIILAAINNPGSIAANWIHFQGVIGYTTENSANKETTLSPLSNIKYPTSKAVADYLTAQIGSVSGLPPGGTVNDYLRGDQTWQVLDKSDVGLNNVTNNAQLIRASDYGTFTALTSVAANDLILLEDVSDSSNKKFSTITDLTTAVEGVLGTKLVPTLTTSRAIVSNGSGVLSAATTTSAEIGFVNGVTSSIQTQLDNKLSNTLANLQNVVTPSTPSSGTYIYTKAGGVVCKMATDGIEQRLDNQIIPGTLGGILTRSGTSDIANSSVIITTDTTFTSPTDGRVPTQKAVADYIATQVVSTAKQSAKVISVVNIPVTGSGVITTVANGALTIDGYGTMLGDSVILNGQTTQATNGIYTITTQGTVSTPTVLTRRTDYDSPSEIKAGVTIAVTNGTTYTGTIWYETSTVTVLETDPISFLQINVGSGLLTTSNNLSELTPTATVARGNISAAKSGINTDITSVTVNDINIISTSSAFNVNITVPTSLTANRTLTLVTPDSNSSLILTTSSATLSGVNTGDETAGSIATKVGNASASNTGLLTSANWTTFNNKESTSNKGIANGYASLNGSGVIPLAQLPALSLSSLSDVVFT